MQGRSELDQAIDQFKWGTTYWDRLKEVFGDLLNGFKSLCDYHIKAITVEVSEISGKIEFLGRVFDVDISPVFVDGILKGRVALTELANGTRRELLTFDIDRQYKVVRADGTDFVLGQVEAEESLMLLGALKDALQTPNYRSNNQ